MRLIQTFYLILPRKEECSNRQVDLWVGLGMIDFTSKKTGGKNHWVNFRVCISVQTRMDGNIHASSATYYTKVTLLDIDRVKLTLKQPALLNG